MLFQRKSLSFTFKNTRRGQKPGTFEAGKYVNQFFFFFFNNCLTIFLKGKVFSRVSGYVFKVGFRFPIDPQFIACSKNNSLKQNITLF